MKTTVRRHQRDRGQSLVEMGLMLPFLALLVAGIAQFAFLFFASIQVDTAAREGARVAANTPQGVGSSGKVGPFDSNGNITGTVDCASGTYWTDVPACRAIWNNRGEIASFTDATIQGIAPVGGTAPCSNVNSAYTGPEDGYVRVTVTYKAPVFVPFINQLLSDSSSQGTRTLSWWTTMRVAPCAITTGK